MAKASLCIFSRRVFPPLHWALRLSRACTDMASCTDVACTSLDQYFVPPEEVKGSKVLDRAAFRREFQLPAVRLAQPQLCSSFLKKLAHARLKCRNIIKDLLTEQSEDGKSVSKVLLLGPSHLRPLSAEDHEWIAGNGGEEVTRVVTLDYESFPKRTILRAIFPPEIQEVPSGMELVGHIAHYNLEEEHLPYKHIIGQVTLDKDSRLRTVVNKTDNIDATFRFFKMEVLAGDHDFMATVKENGCTFTFDFSSVYWNSRLQVEHERLVELLGKNDVVLDVFAGVGPFAIPAAKYKHCTVHANDLNPHSFKYLKENAKTNLVSNAVEAYNLDGREFLVSVSQRLARKMVERLAKGEAELGADGKVDMYSHVIMNLPGSAVEFLDVFRGLFSCVPLEHRSAISMPIIHCYCFVKAETPEEEAVEELQKAALKAVSEHLGGEVTGNECEVEVVRSVAPRKTMMRVSFRLPQLVGYAELQGASAEGGGAEGDEVSEHLEPSLPQPKRCKLE